MVGLARLIVVGFVVLTVIYVCALFYARAVQRDRLEAEWDAEKGPGSRADYVDAGLEAYSQSLRRKLLLGIYVVPVAIVALIIYLTNYA